MYIVHKFCRCATAKLTWPKTLNHGILSPDQKKMLHIRRGFCRGSTFEISSNVCALSVGPAADNFLASLNGVFGIN
jgi:hypothetical protein